MIFPAKIIDGTTCECDLKDMSRISRPMPYDLTVLLEPLSPSSIPGFVALCIYENVFG